MKDTRTEKDSLGEIEVPGDALYGAQTRRAVDNFKISGIAMAEAFISALGLVKWACATANEELGLLDTRYANAIKTAAAEVVAGQHMKDFPIDVFQTGSGTSSNMNANEVIARLASNVLSEVVHPNDHVNMSQSSNDVIPTTVHVSACLMVHRQLKPALTALIKAIDEKASGYEQVVKTGRTHLMDAMPLTVAQEFSAWSEQIRLGCDRIDDGLKRLSEVALGGTAVGTGVNAPAGFAEQAIVHMSENSGFTFTGKRNKFEGLASQDAAVEMSGHLNTLAVSMTKIANDLRWMSSGPLAGLAELVLTGLQPGSSIMPGKVNPVIPEAVLMAMAQVMGNHVTITVAGQAGNFQLNVMLPVISHNLLQSIELLSNCADAMADKVFSGLTVNEFRLAETVSRNPILVTALNRVIGYDKGAAIAKRAYAEGRPVLEVALEETDLDKATLEELLDPLALTSGD